MSESDPNPVLFTSADHAEGALPPRSATNDAVHGNDGGDPGVLGEYKIIGKLGVGGMGTVWRAQLISGGRQVALKLLNAGHLTSDIAKRRFEREVEVASLLEHPNIARVYESGVHHGAYFYAMELIEGISLDDYVQQHHFDRRATLALMAVICRAMQYAHQKGVIHRDLKPSNILVDVTGCPHIVDFGLGKLLDEQTPFSTISVEGGWVGTPAYMSPEQAAGTSRQVDTRSDIYSLGVILYQLLTKRLPHDTSGGNLAVLQCVAHAEIIRPRVALPGMDRDLESVLLKSLARRPEDRYASIGQFAQDIDNYLNGDPVNARRLTALYYLRKKIAKHLAPIAAAATAIAVIVTILINASHRVALERNRALAAAANAEHLWHVSQVNLADVMLLIADDQKQEGRWPEAINRYWDAYKIQSDEGTSTFSTKLGLLDAIRHAPAELSEIKQSASTPELPVGMVFDTNGTSAWMEGTSGIAQSYDLLTALPKMTTGKWVSEGQIMSMFDCPDRNYIYRVHWINSPTEKNPATDIEKVDLLTGGVQPILHFAGFMGPTDISPDAASVATYGWLTPPPKVRYVAYVWGMNADTCADPQKVPIQSDMVADVSLSPDLQTIAFGDQAGHIYFWDRVNGIETHPFDTEHGLPGGLGSQPIICVKYAPDGSGILVGDQSGNLGFLALSPSRQTRSFEPSDSCITLVGFSHDSRWALSADANGLLCVWDINTGELHRVFSVGTQIASAKFSSDDRMILACTRDGSVHVWPVDNDDQNVIWHAPKPILSMAISPDDLVAAVGAGNDLDVIDIATGRRLWGQDFAGNVMSVKFSSTGAALNVATEDGALSQFEVFGNWERIASLPAGTTTKVTGGLKFQTPTGRTQGVFFSPASDLAIALSTQGTMFIDGPNMEHVRFQTGHNLPMGCFSSDGNAFATLSNATHPMISVIDTHNGVSSDMVFGPSFQNRFAAVALSPNADTGIISFIDSTVRATDLRSGKEIWSMAAGGKVVNSLEVSPDGASLLLGAEDGTLQLWKESDGTPLRSLAKGLGTGLVATFSPRGDMILCSRASDNALCLWDTSLPARLRDEESKAGAARQQLAINSSSIPARAALVEWYRMQGASEWANDLLDGGPIEADAGIAAARSRWQGGNFTTAVDDFDALLQHNDSSFPIAYLQACRDAAARHE